VQIVKYPHPTLRRKSKPLKRVDRDLKAMIGEMFELMYAHEGLGLAANQVDLPYRLFVINIEGHADAKEEERVFINPVILRRSGQAEDREGCLSFPEIYAPVTRPEKIVVNGYGLDGQEFTYEMSGLLGRAVQHETDHLEGILFIDRLSEANRMAIRGELEELELAFSTDRRMGLIPPDERIAARLGELEAART